MSAAGRRSAKPAVRTSALNPHSTGFAAFSDALYTGVLVFALALPVVTWFAALSAGIEELRESRIDDRHVRAGRVWAAFAHRVRRHPISHVLVPLVLTALVIVDVVLLPYVAPGELWAIVLPVALAAGLGAVALRIAGAWRRDRTTRSNVMIAWRRMSDDAGGSALLVLAVMTAGTLVTVAPMLAFVMFGPVALAAVAMDRRAEQAEDYA